MTSLFRSPNRPNITYNVKIIYLHEIHVWLKFEHDAISRACLLQGMDKEAWSQPQTKPHTHTDRQSLTL